MDNVDLAKYNEILEKLKFGEYTYKYIYEKKNKKENNFDKEYRIVEGNNCFIVHKIKGDEFSLFFNKPKKVNYLDIGKTQTLIFSTLQIDEFMKENSIQDFKFQYNGNTAYYSKQKSILNQTGDEIKCKTITLINLNFELSSVLLEKEKFSPFALSQYFYDYFEYNNPETEKEFIYYETPERTQLKLMLMDFYFCKINYFKFCGPISGGKSTTLLKFKNEYKGVIYFNLKAIKKYYLEGNPKYKLIMLNELSRVKINDKKEEDVKKELINIMKDNEVLEIIFIKIIDFLLSLGVRNILIIDQFKNIHFDYTILNEIQQKIYNTKIGLILSSSIDEKEIKKELEITLNTYYKMPNDITFQNQKYYIYVPDLLKNKNIKEIYASQNKISKDFIDLYEQFSFKTKYISILGKEEENLDNGITQINNEITDKMIKQSVFPELISLNFLLLLINDYIEVNMEYTEENINILRKIPLKFIDIHFDDNYFFLHYSFPYIKTLVETTKKKLDVKKYFEQKMYEKQFYCQFKGIYFEETINRSILEGKIYFDKKIEDKKIYNIIVNNILEMKEIDRENNVYTIINRIKYKTKDSSCVQKNYQDYNYDRAQKIQEEFKNIKNGQIYFNNNLIQALEEELKILEKEKKDYEKIRDLRNISDKFGKKNIIFYDEEFKKGNILIEQIQTKGRCFDSAFLFGDKNNKTLICLQMRFYDETTIVSDKDKKQLEKPYIKSACRKVLSNIYLKLGIKVESWHYIVILYLDYEKNTFNTNIVKICMDKDLEYVFFDPILKKFYNREKKEINFVNLNFLTNIDNDENESNPINCFEYSQIINSYMNKRNRDLRSKKSPKAIAQKNAKYFESKYKLSFNIFFQKIKNKYKYIKNIKIILSLKMEINKCFPILRDGYGFIFLNDNKNGLIFVGKTKNLEDYITYNGENMDYIAPNQINSYINIEEEFMYFIVKLS